MSKGLRGYKEEDEEISVRIRTPTEAEEEVSSFLDLDRGAATGQEPEEFTYEELDSIEELGPDTDRETRTGTGPNLPTLPEENRPTTATNTPHRPTAAKRKGVRIGRMAANSEKNKSS